MVAQGGARSEDGRTAVSANNIMSPQDEEKGGKTMRRKRITLQGALTAVHDRYIPYPPIPPTTLPYHPFYPPTHPTSSPPYCLSILLVFHHDLPQTLHTPSLSPLPFTPMVYIPPSQFHHYITTSVPLSPILTFLLPSHPPSHSSLSHSPSPSPPPSHPSSHSHSTH